MMQYAEIGDDVYFWFAANETTGTAGDGATPLYDVRLAGAAANAAPTASGTPTLLTHADYPDGIHEIKIDTDAFSAGEYAVFCSLTISTVNPVGFVGAFKLRTAGTAAFMVGLIDDAITAAKYDESTAFPLKSADTGSTAVARTGADSDTLEVLSDEIAALQADVGDASASTLGSLYAILGNAAASLTSRTPAALTANGNMKASLMEILATALTETSGYLAAGFKKFFNVGSPTGTVNSIPDAVAGANGGLPTTNGTKLNQTVDPTNGSIANASFNADVGSTAYATNIIALAVRKVLDEIKLDHLVAVAESDDPVDNSIIAKLAATGGDWSTFAGSTDALQAIRDRGDAAWVTATGFSTHSAADVVTAMETNGSKLDHLWEMTEDDGGTRRLTANALEESPAAGAAPTVGEIRTEMETAGGYLALTKTAAEAIDALTKAAGDGDLAALLTAATAIQAKTDNLPSGVKKNTAISNFPFLMVLASDHITPATGVTVTATRRLDSGSFAACANAPTEVGNGIYTIDLAAADLNGDTVMLSFAEATCDTRTITIITEP